MQMTSERRPRRLRWLAAGALAACAVAGAVAAQPADAQLGSTATCSLDIQLTLRPGLVALTSRTGSIVSSRPGSLNCVGLIAGSPVVGPGTFSVAGTYRGTCAQGSTSGQAEFSIPTAAGIAAGTATYTVTWAGIAGFITVVDPVYGTGSGPFEFLPVTGNCATRPLSGIRWLSQQIVFSS